MLIARTIIMGFPDGTRGKESESRSVVSSCLWPRGLYYTVHGILQARIPEWVAFPFSRGSSQPRDRALLLRCRWTCYQLRAPACQCRRHETQVQSLGWEDQLEEHMATHMSILAGDSHGERSLEGHGLWDHKEPHTTA